MIKHNNRCTLCLSFNKRTLNIFRTNLQYVYENLANLKVGSETWMCFICHERLRQCHLLQQLAINTRGLIANICEVDTKFESLLELSTSDTRIICLPSTCETQYAATIKTEPDETSEVHLNDTEIEQDKDVETTNDYEDGEQNPGSSCADSDEDQSICDDDTLKVDINNSRQTKKELLLIIEKLSPSIIAKFVRSSPEKRSDEHFEEELEEVVADTDQKRRNGTRQTNRRCKKKISIVDAKPVQAIDQDISDKNNTLLTSVPVSAHENEPPSCTHCSFIISNFTNIADQYLNVNHNLKSNKSLSTQNQESVPFSEAGHKSSFDESFSDIPDSQMHSFCKSSHMLSKSFVKNFLLDSGKKISDDPTYVSSVVVSDVPPPVAVDLPGISNHTSLPDSENVEKNPTYLLSSDNIEPPPMTVDPPTSNHARPLDPENIEQNNTCLISTDNVEPPPKASKSSILSPIRQLDPADNTNLNKPTYVSDVDDIKKPPLEVPCIIPDDRNQDQSVPYFDNESDFSESSNDRNYEPSSYESTSESGQEILMETECLDGSYKAASSYCDDRSPTEKEKLSLEEDCLGEDSENNHEPNKENIETEVPENKKKLEINLKGKRIRERDFCYYCKNFILNFARHMIRNHSTEPEVQSALAHPKNSPKRKQVFSALRKKGNYVGNSQTAFKPVKKCRFSEKADYLPCSKCLGFYSRKHLWKHVKKCDNAASTNNVQADAQNFLVRYVKVDNNLMKNVFPRMKPDKISLVAKKDKLICMFGAQYLRTHREKHFANVVSRKMRELAKLLVEVTKLNPNINSLEQVLKPQYYDILVQATKIVARYNDSSQTFDAPTYAMNIATSIKQCCSIALLKSRKSEASVQTASVQADLKTLSKLIMENWKFDISRQAADDLYAKKWNKTTMVPLATDLKFNLKIKSEKKKRTLVPWTTEQKNVVTKYFKDHIKYKKPPKRAECDELKNKYSTLFHNKDWLKIKVYIQNIYSKS